jgi:predicted GNAT family acetyltransferase
LSIYFKFDEYLSTIYNVFNIKIFHRSKLLKTKHFKYSDTSKSVSILVSDYFFKNYSDSSELQIQLTVKSDSLNKTKRIRRKIKYGTKYLEYTIRFERSIQKFNTENLFIKDDKLLFSRDTNSQISHYKQIN